MCTIWTEQTPWSYKACFHDIAVHFSVSLNINPLCTRITNKQMDALPCPTVDTHHILFDIILPFIRARYDRRMQAHRDTVDRMRNGECPECMNKYYDLWKDKRNYYRNVLFAKHFQERHDPVYRRAMGIEARAEVFRLTRLGRRLLHLHTHPNIHPDNLD